MDLTQDEARDLWERFGQVAPPPPRTLVVVKRPQPMRRSDGSKSVALHPSEAASYCDSYNAGGGELYLRLSDGGPDESSGWFFQVVADTTRPRPQGATLRPPTWPPLVATPRPRPSLRQNLGAQFLSVWLLGLFCSRA
jgi:hypothetical protein